MNKEKIKLGVVTAALLMGTTVTMAAEDLIPEIAVPEDKSFTGKEAEDLIPEISVPAAESFSGWESKHKFFGFSQIGVAIGDGATGASQDSNYKFQADRIRLGWAYFSGPLAAKVFLDFAKEGKDNGAIGVPDMIKDAFLAYKFDDAAVIKAGVIKTPVGMGFTIPGWNLDVIKRGFDKKLAFERAFGVMISGRDIGFGNNGKVNGLEMGHERPWKGFGYDLMISGPTGRSGAVAGAKQGVKNGDSNAYMGRIIFDWTELLHVEASYGVAESAGGIDIDDTIDGNQGTEDYKVFNFGIDSHFDRANLKAEYYDTKNVRGIDGWNIKTLALTGTYYLTDTIEAAVKYIGGQGEQVGQEETDVSNTYFGLNYYINPKNNKMDRKSRRARNRHRIQLNYVYAGGDAKNARADQSDAAAQFEKYASGAFFTEDTILLQYQFKF